MEQNVLDWIRPEIQQLQAYHVADAQNYIKLDAMENPYPLPEEVVQEWLDFIRSSALNRYPSPQAGELKTQLRNVMAVPDSEAILLGNGSDELIQMLCIAVAQPDRVILSPTPSFVMYDMIAKFTKMRYIGVPLQKDFQLDYLAMLNAIKTYQPAIIFLAYPNNPTGNLFASAEVEEILCSSNALVVVDEAYYAFASNSFMPLLGKYNNLLVMRTVSKIGLAGLRLGLLAGNAPLLDEIDKVRMPYNINILTQKTALFLLRQHEILAKQAKRICRNRQVLYDDLRNIVGLKVFPSEANFILFRVDNANAVFDALKAEGILIKNLHPAGGLLHNCLRVTVGTETENKRFMYALENIVR